MERAQIEEVARQIVDGTFRIHKSLGPGLLESAYQRYLVHELRQRGLSIQQQLAVPLVYEGVRIDVGYRLDLLVEGCVVVENKAVDVLLPIHQAQLLTYLKLTGCRLGFLINWNVHLIKNGMRRMVLGL
ncbi:GxxExxY protein [Acidobacteria bacterium AH-259-A15]|nr:GxxExxY protein [Acidobacteria bacterium AH-259-A15]